MTNKTKVIQELIGWQKNGYSSGRSLPPGCYFDSELFSMEQEHIFRRGWVCLGRASQLKKPGDYITRIISGQPLIALLDDTAALRVLSNVCRHRHAILAEDSGNISQLVCPYHAWTYSLSGLLKATPYMERPEDSGCNLPNYKTDIWNGFLFVHLGMPNSNIATLTEGLKIDLVHYELNNQIDIYFNEMEIATNWKMMVENFTESYHLFRVHPDTLEPYTPTKTLELGESGDGFNRHYVYYREKYRQQPVGRNIPTPHCDREVVACIYPNLLIVAAQDSTVWACVEPRSVGNILLRYGVLQHEEYQSEPNYNELIQEQIDLTEAFNSEDKVLLESIFRGVSAPDSGSSTLCPLERTLLDFANYYVTKLLDNFPE